MAQLEFYLFEAYELENMIDRGSDLVMRQLFRGAGVNLVLQTQAAQILIVSIVALASTTTDPSGACVCCAKSITTVHAHIEICRY